MLFKYILRKIIYALSALWGVVSLVFILFNILPGDPARLTIGQRSDLATLENIRKELYLDKPMVTRYLLFINDLSPVSIILIDSTNKEKYDYIQLIVFKRDKSLVLKKPYLGRSYQAKRPVAHILSEALPGTIVLAFSAIFIALVLGICLGVLAALKKGTVWDIGAMFVSVAGISAPSFFAGLLIAYIFGYILSGYTGLQLVGSLWEYDLDGQKHLSIRHLILPAFTLGIRPMAIIAQLVRSSLLDTLSQDYVRTAYAKGLNTSKVVMYHALPNALNPIVTAVSGWLAELLAGSFFVEYIFSWKGLGKLTVDALDKFDFPVVMGAILVAASIFVIINMLTDILYTLIDPRVKLR